MQRNYDWIAFGKHSVVYLAALLKLSLFLLSEGDIVFVLFFAIQM
jgi:hypothetical protein